MGGGAGEGNVFQLCCVYLYFCGKFPLEEIRLGRLCLVCLVKTEKLKKISHLMGEGLTGINLL